MSRSTCTSLRLTAPLRLRGWLPSDAVTDANGTLFQTLCRRVLEQTRVNTRVRCCVELTLVSCGTLK